MCTVTIDIDEKTLRDVNPNLSDIAAIRRWAQQLIDCRIQEMVAEDEETISVEELRAMLHKTILTQILYEFLAAYPYRSA